MTTVPHAHGAGAVPSASDEGPTVAAVVPPESTRHESPDSHGAPHAGQALRVIEGETKAAQCLARPQAQQADPDELALIVSMLCGATLRGFCSAIERVPGVRHA